MRQGALYPERKRAGEREEIAINRFARRYAAAAFEVDAFIHTEAEQISGNPPDVAVSNDENGQAKKESSPTTLPMQSLPARKQERAGVPQRNASPIESDTEIQCYAFLRRLLARRPNSTRPPPTSDVVTGSGIVP